MAANFLPDEAPVRTAQNKPVAFLAVAALIIAGFFATLYLTSNNNNQDDCAENKKELQTLRKEFIAYIIKSEADKVDLIKNVKKNTDSAIREAVNKNPNIK